MGLDHSSPPRYFDVLVCAFVCVLLSSSFMGTKVAQFEGITFGAGVLFFPFSYLIGSLAVETYGMAYGRRLVLLGFIALAFSALMSVAMVRLPAAPHWPYQNEYSLVFGDTWRVECASILAYAFGELSNIYVFAAIRSRTEGRWLWLRLVSSTVVGAALDSIIFYPLAFFGVWEYLLLLRVMMVNYLAKCCIEILGLPLSYTVIAMLRKWEAAAAAAAAAAKTENQQESSL